MKERTFFMIKPDCSGNPMIRADIERTIAEAGLSIIAQKRHRFTREEIEDHYREHLDKLFFEPTVEYMTSGEVVMMVLEGENAIQKTRDFLGATRPWEAEPGTLRFKYGTKESLEGGLIKNSGHASDGPETAKREIELHFPELAAA